MHLLTTERKIDRSICRHNGKDPEKHSLLLMQYNIQSQAIVRLALLNFHFLAAFTKPLPVTLNGRVPSLHYLLQRRLGRIMWIERLDSLAPQELTSHHRAAPSSLSKSASLPLCSVVACRDPTLFLVCLSSCYILYRKILPGALQH